MPCVICTVCGKLSSSVACALRILNRHIISLIVRHFVLIFPCNVCAFCMLMTSARDRVLALRERICDRDLHCEYAAVGYRQSQKKCGTFAFFLLEIVLRVLPTCLVRVLCSRTRVPMNSSIIFV